MYFTRWETPFANQRIHSFVNSQSVQSSASNERASYHILSLTNAFLLTDDLWHGTELWLGVFVAVGPWKMPLGRGRLR